MRGLSYLNNVVAELENDRTLHPIVLDQEIHTLGAFLVREYPVDIALERLGHVLLKVGHQVDLAIQFFREDLNTVAPARVHIGTSVRDIVKCSGGNVRTMACTMDLEANLLSCWCHYHRRGIIEVYTRRTVGKLIGSSILVGIIDPCGNEDFGRRHAGRFVQLQSCLAGNDSLLQGHPTRLENVSGRQGDPGLRIQISRNHR